MGGWHLAAALVIVACLSACGERTVDWNAPEDLLFAEDTEKTHEGLKLQYWSLVDAPAHAVYDALTDVEHYAEFIPGVSRVQILSVSENKKTVQIAQRVVSQQASAKVEWRFDPRRLRIEFHTLESSLSLNDGSYQIEGSPDGQRCVVRTTFLVRGGEHAPSVPESVLASATREAFLAAAAGIKRRASGNGS